MKETEYYVLTDDDYTCIEEMTGFYDITPTEAYERFMSGDYDGVMPEALSRAEKAKAEVEKWM